MEAGGNPEYILEERQTPIPGDESSNDIKRKSHLDELQRYNLVKAIAEHQSEDPRP